MLETNRRAIVFTDTVIPSVRRCRMNALLAWTPHSISPESLECVLTASREGEHILERRTAERFPFFVQMNLAPADASEPHVFAYSRELSTDGLGLLHTVPLPTGAVYEIAAADPRFPFRQHAEVIWSRYAGQGWYLSGWHFVSAAD